MNSDVTRNAQADQRLFGLVNSISLTHESMNEQKSERLPLETKIALQIENGSLGLH